MNLKAVQVKHLTQMEDLAKQLLLALSKSELGDDAICEELVALAIETSDELQLRSRADAAQQAQDSTSRLQNWDNEGGAIGKAASRRLLSRIHNGQRELVWADERKKT